MPYKDDVSLNKLHDKLIDIPTVFLPLTEAETMNIRDNIGTVNPGGEIPDGIKEKISGIIQREFPDGAFVKMVSRSPKDSFIGYIEGFKCLTGQHAINLLYDSERILDDTYEYSPEFSCLALRKWVDMSSQLEFRLFIKDRQLQGISQYYYHDYIEQILQKKEALLKEINEKFAEIKGFLPLDDVIVDFFYDGSRMLVIECNPYSRFTDPCLFDWDAPIDGFRTLDAPPDKKGLQKYIDFVSNKKTMGESNE